MTGVALALDLALDLASYLALNLASYRGATLSAVGSFAILGGIVSSCVLWSLGMPAAANAAAAGDVRVLLYSDAAPLRIGSIDSVREVRLADARELFVPGQGRLRRWSPTGQGPFRVGDRVVRGRVLVRAHQGEIQVLNVVDLEQYVASTVGGEMLASWPREALRAQAVAARTYVLHEAYQRHAEGWDVLATTASQVYQGVGAETAETRAAARATANQVLTYDGRPILAVFHSSAGGRTEAAGDVWGEDRPYLRVLDVDDEDDAPHTYWRRVVSRRDLESLLESLELGVGRLEAVEIVARTRGGRVKRLKLGGTQGSVVAESERLKQLVAALDLYSKLFEIRTTRDSFAFVGSGHGHGVGMSQWGARAMARRGSSYERILQTFYPGAQLETWQPRHAARSRSVERASYVRPNVPGRDVQRSGLSRGVPSGDPR